MRSSPRLIALRRIDDGADNQAGASQPAANDRPARLQQAGARAILGMFFFVISEIVFFGSLALAFLLVRAGHGLPLFSRPAGPIHLALCNTIILVGSGLTLSLAHGRIRHRDPHGLRRWLAATAILGTAFLLGQSAELLRFLQANTETAIHIAGAAFLVLLGTHALHAALAVAAGWYVWWQARHGYYSREHHAGLVVYMMFWFLLVLVWPLLFLIIYFTSSPLSSSF